MKGHTICKNCQRPLRDHRASDDRCPHETLSTEWLGTRFEAIEESKLPEGMVLDVCCDLCRKFEDIDCCPVNTASPWSRHKDYCGAFVSKETGLGVRGTILRNEAQS
jgi:hypothetical protein